METGDIRNAYPVGAAAAASSGAPASSVPTSTASAAPPAGRNGRRLRPDRTVAKRMVSYRRRRQWAAWMPLGVAKCRLVDGGVCPYYGPAGCPEHRLRAAGEYAAVPPCFAERRSLLALADSLVMAGWPSALATLVGAALLRGNRDGDGRLIGDALRTANGVGIELVRASARRAAAGKAEGEGLDGYMQLLAGAPGGAA